MKLKQIPEDFIVEEIIGVVPSEYDAGGANYIWFTLKKKGWDLLKLISVMAKQLGIPRHCISYAGLKDKQSVSVQTVSVRDVPLEKLKSLKIDGVEISNFVYSDSPLKLGELKGNKFTIIARDVESVPNLEIRSKNASEKGILNIFDTQRFGGRGVTNLVGKEIVGGDLEAAVFLYLTKTSRTEPDDLRAARKRLADTGNFSEALRRFPARLKWERLIINHLVKNPQDYTGALRRLPPTLKLMFIHAYQSYLWNKCAEMLKGSKENLKIPIIGYGTKLTNSAVDKVAKKILNQEKLKPEDFRIKSIQELSSAGSSRDLFVFPKHLKYRVEEDELNKGKKKIIFSFSLQKGSYATQVVKELLK